MFKCEGSKYFKGVQTASLIDTGGILDFSLARRDKSQAETSPVKGRE